MRYFLLLLFLLLPSASVFASKIAIIIDDIGYRQSDKAVLSLPSNITLSILPHTPLGKSLASEAYHQGNEILVHLPMQALNGKAIGPGALTNAMEEAEFKSQLKDSITSVPYASGANNHMGSLLTQLDDPMRWVMESLQQHNIYFIDSMTTKYTRAGAMAETIGIPLLRREIFLDNDRSQAGLEKQFQHAISLAHEKSNIVVIAHPYPETISFLIANLHRLANEEIELVHTSQLLPQRVNAKISAKRVLLQD
ncbi:divergent polysaccharide deacetylase family protein [Shewanella sp. Isolate13]|uniref:divergent polysaccharide deacetylase family protein n=1 Tax=Shewanella sp. Isolate13 TaxID=2908531 RepID=UPI001EFDE4ED|nr:divergent polysaccharide deacetylase family protein [Shewanella sp. Isolate13]